MYCDNRGGRGWPRGDVEGYLLIEGKIWLVLRELVGVFLGILRWEHKIIQCFQRKLSILKCLGTHKDYVCRTSRDGNYYAVWNQIFMALCVKLRSLNFSPWVLGS